MECEFIGKNSGCSTSVCGWHVLAWCTNAAHWLLHKAGMLYNWFPTPFTVTQRKREAVWSMTYVCTLHNSQSQLTYSKADQICAATGRIILPIVNLCTGKHKCTYNSQVASFSGSSAPEHWQLQMWREAGVFLTYVSTQKVEKGVERS